MGPAVEGQKDAGVAGSNASDSTGVPLHVSGSIGGSVGQNSTWGLDGGSAEAQLCGIDEDASPSTRRGSVTERFFSQMTVGGVRHSMLTLTSTALGGGVLSVSYVMHLGGVGIGCAMLLIGASLSFCSTAALMQLSTTTGKGTYAALFAHCVGARAGPVLDAMLFVYGCGSCVGYMVFLGDFIPSLMSLVAPHAPALIRSREFAIVGASILLLPLVLQRDVAALRHVAPVSILSLVYMAIVIAAKAPALHQTHEADPSYGGLEVVNISYRLCEAFAICVFAFNCHLNVVPVAGSLVRPTKARITKVSFRVNLLQLSFYMLIGVSGYMSFLHKTPQDIIKGYDENDLFVAGGRLMLSFTMLVAIPINLLPTIRSALQIGDYFKGAQPGQSGEVQASSGRDAARVTLTIVALACQAFLAILVPGVADILGLLGATVATAMMLGIPAYAMGVLMPQTAATRVQRALLYTFALVSVASVPIKVLKWCKILPS